MLGTINISQALAIDGWMSEWELVWLAQQAVEHRCIVEIGSYLGRSTRALLDHTEGVVYAYDDWKGPRDVSVENRRTLYERFIHNVRDHICTGKLKVSIVDHANILLSWKVPVDMVFIDGSHEYEDVKRDIEVWKGRIIKGGLLCGHDINFDGVVQAVNEVLGQAPIVFGTNIWYKTI